MAKYSRHFRKRLFQAPGGNSPFSLELRKIGRDASRNRHDLALARVDQLLAGSSLDSWQQSRVLSIVADCEFIQGHYKRAAGIYLQAASGCSDHHRLWFRPLLGHVRALLKVPQVDMAATMAQHALDQAKSKMADFNQSVRAANRLVSEKQTVIIPALPIRTSVVATRLANLFMQEGEPEIARTIYEEAIRASPGGANRAKQGLARLALAHGDCKTALVMSAEAIRQGKFRVKTIPAWPVLISARRQLGGWRISENLVKELDSAPAEIRARTIMVIVVELRKNGMRQWREIADGWSRREGHRFPIIEAEMRKLCLASAKTELGNAVSQREAAEEVLRVPGLSPQEWRMASKELVRASLRGGQEPDFPALIRSAGQAYGDKFSPMAAHSLALACLAARRPDLARPLLADNIQNGNAGSRLWSQSVWTMARLESSAANHVAAAALYQKLFEESAINVRFRLQAKLHWAEAMIAAGDSNALAQSRPLMSSVLSEVRDPEILMNFARQLRMGAPELGEFAQEIFARGETMALRQFDESAHPAEAVSILFKLTRRQVIDFGRNDAVVALWERLDAAKQDWLWSDCAAFWGYVGLVFEAYVRSGHVQAAVRLAHGILADPATPPHGAPYVGIPLARRLMEGGEPDDALALFERLSELAPSHFLCAWAWYWLALDSWRHDDLIMTHRFAENIQMAQGAQPGTRDQWCLDARGLLLKADLDPGRIDLRACCHNAAFLHEQLQQISSDLSRLA